MASRRKKIPATVTNTSDTISPSDASIAVLDAALPEDGQELSPVRQAEIARDALLPAPRPAWIDGAPTEQDGRFVKPDRRHGPTPAYKDAPAESVASANEPSHRKNWGNPYKSIFSCPEMGFELGEDRRFKQRVFRFSEKPSADVLTTLKENGFAYRAIEKSWTIPANPDTRRLTDELARDWAGPNYIKSIER